ncbi:hypothetical protein pdam_00008840 [Pocillopora damicornis]|uniref:Uncharacterized protein n=1 Tax=Pocillopora damicornis TaxID=46731 RepID=A0A3M6URT6_POCDA|nr:hypothetical protein pdam_00008840 [Pocillopora damicornis]
MWIHQLQLNDIPRDQAVDAAIAQKITQKDVRGNPHGESSSSGVNQVKRDNVWSHGHSVGRRHRRKRSFRRWLNNHTFKGS